MYLCIINNYIIVTQNFNVWFENSKIIIRCFEYVFKRNQNMFMNDFQLSTIHIHYLIKHIIILSQYIIFQNPETLLYSRNTDDRA